MAAGVRPEPIDHERVLEVGARAAGDLVALLREVVPRLGGSASGFVDWRAMDLRDLPSVDRLLGRRARWPTRRDRWRRPPRAQRSSARVRRSAPATTRATLVGRGASPSSTDSGRRRCAASSTRPA